MIRLTDLLIRRRRFVKIVVEGVEIDIFLDKNIYRRGGPPCPSSPTRRALRTECYAMQPRLDSKRVSQRVLREGFPLRIEESFAC